MKKLILLTLLPLTIASCSAQNQGDMNIFKRIFNGRPECGGTISKDLDPKPLENVKGYVTYISCTYNDADVNYKSVMPRALELFIFEGKLKGSVSRQNDSKRYDSFNYELPFNEQLGTQIADAIRNSGMLAFNEYSWVVAGLPPCYDFDISATFSSGEKLYIKFNGDRCPAGFRDVTNSFVTAICKMVDYSPEKCPEEKPYVSPFIGEHHFVYNGDGKTQSFTFIMRQKVEDGCNAEVISDGDFGYIHLKCSTSNVSGGLFFDVVSHYEDSKIQSVAKNSLAGILSIQDGVIYLKPLQAAPDLQDRSLLKEQQ